ncbi:hypothetical protein CTI12_AA578900 [Artemisia annua]|uniref:Uncharacterized protein n=1 Tax=Artemisia annua TaxID=35608 RepID=A0A2U1KPB3_ARTAN|nr:hypothetical protein CTI12_AA578900 [Artemisia annua]
MCTQLSVTTKYQYQEKWIDRIPVYLTFTIWAVQLALPIITVSHLFLLVCTTMNNHHRITQATTSTQNFSSTSADQYQNPYLQIVIDNRSASSSLYEAPLSSTATDSLALCTK